MRIEAIQRFRRVSRRRLRKLARTAQSSAPWIREPKHRAQAAILARRHRPHEADFELLRHLTISTDHCIVDVGANRGQSIRSIRIFQPAVPIEAFEPQSTLVERLRDEHGTDPLVEVHHAGLGEAAGELILFVPVYRGYVYDGLASTIRADAEEWLSPRTVYRFRADQLELREEHVEIRVLDDLDLAPAFVKIDVQGAEPAVLRGGQKTIDEHRPIILMEAPSDDLIAELETWHYVPRWWSGASLVDRSTGGPNTFFVPSDGTGAGWKLPSEVLSL